MNKLKKLLKHKLLLSSIGFVWGILHVLSDIPHLIIMGHIGTVGIYPLVNISYGIRIIIGILAYRSRKKTMLCWQKPSKEITFIEIFQLFLMFLPTLYAIYVIRRGYTINDPFTLTTIIENPAIWCPPEIIWILVAYLIVLIKDFQNRSRLE